MNKHRLLLTLLSYAFTSCVLSYVNGSFHKIENRTKVLKIKKFFNKKKGVIGEFE